MPSFRLDRDTFKRYCELVFTSPLQRRAARRIVDNTRIDARYLVAAPDEILAPRSLQDKSAAYARHALQSQAQMFGDSVDIDGYATWWSYIPHFIGTPGYVYA